MKFTARFFLCTVLLLTASVFSPLNGEDNEYNCNKIPAFLKKEAGAVIREYLLRFEVKNEKRAVLKVKRAVTIFNKEEQQEYGRLVLEYDKFSEVESLEGRILESNGQEVRELEDSDVKDVSAFSDYSLYEDNRVKIAELYYNRFPYTVEFTYEISFKGYLNWPVWLSQESLQPVEKSRFEVLLPEDQTLRYWTNSDSLKPAVSSEDGKKLYSWEAKNLPLLSKDIIGDDIEDIAAIVRTAPGNFELDGFRGNMETWKDFGLWINRLYKDRSSLPDDAIKDVNAIAAASGSSKPELIRKLYRYMQKRTRYVSVQLGIGGYQPFDAKYVHEKGYGDCKALSNYMVSLLKQAGVKAFPVLIRNGHFRRPMIKEFPSNQFNHVIVCVPLEEQDTLWLECTSQTTPPGFLGSSCENRQALMITDEGGIVVQTPGTSSSYNLQQRNLSVDISSLGSLKLDAEIKWTGNQQDDPRSIIKESTPEDREKWILYSLETPMAKLEKVKSIRVEDEKPEVQMNLSLSLPNYASASGNRLFFQPNIMERRTDVPGNVAVRLSPLRFGYPYLDVDSVCYKIPGGYRVEAMPEVTELKTPFGSFSSKTVQTDPSTLIYTRRLEIKSYAVDAKDYAEYRKFISSVVKSDRAQVVLVK
ncbi:MAG: DUF3857 domain-containing protein [Ignavibacteria bacterium]|jgi:hypothetical protein|nr:DUF3857 domain-containing protein [Ignavibacteria bacterium]MCU7516198.1 DUF3857 domain-containing protein [Ignavibacteria bacterium]